MQHFQVRSGSVAGQAHKRLGINNQDACLWRCMEIDSRPYAVGVVCDGCTGDRRKRSSRTEIGAVLLSQFACSEIRLMLTANMRPEDIPQALYMRCAAYVGAVARATVLGAAEEIWNFIQSHFLCTLLGFVADSEQLVIFSAGDGVIIVNDDAWIIDQHDQPLYLAYHQVDRNILGGAALSLPQTFQIRRLELAAVRRFALCSDGIVKRDPESRAAFVDAADIEALWSYEPQAAAGLQWWLNRSSNQLGLFPDDCSVIACSLSGDSRKGGASC